MKKFLSIIILKLISLYFKQAMEQNIKKMQESVKCSLLQRNPVYKPFKYPWAFEAWSMQQKLHWLPEEVSMTEDVRDWKKKLTDNERNLLTQIFRFFTQADVEVNECYTSKYLQVFGPTEIRMMLVSFANIETVHIAGYSYLLDTIGMNETEYQAFLKFQQMRDKWEYMQQFNVESKRDIALTLAVFGAFTEGLQLFASFAILLNFPRFNKMRGMGQIIAWSVRDETLHVHSMLRLFKTFIQENPEIWDDSLRNKITASCREIVSHEDAFIDLAFEMGEIEGLSGQEVKDYIRYIANRRLTQLGLEEIFDIKQNPLGWMDSMLNGVEHSNFFETRATEYSKAATTGTWEEVFAEIVSNA